MARRSAVVARVHPNYDGPPPSTLAAQLVQNQARSAPVSQPSGPAAFKHLLHEILHDDGGAQETDVSVNTQLIHVVVQAGLAPLTIDNPFPDLDAAVDSIKIIGTTVKRQPETLLSSIIPDGPPLFLSLLATLVALLGRPTSQDLAVRELLVSLIEALDSSINLWQNARQAREVVQDCVDDALSALEHMSSSTLAMTVDLPPSRSISRMWSSSQTAITVPQGSRSSISDISSIFMIATELCSIPGLNSMWLHDCYIRLGRALPAFRTTLEKLQQYDCIVDQLLAQSLSSSILSCVICSMTTKLLKADLQIKLAHRLRQMLASQAIAPDEDVTSAVRLLGEDPNFGRMHEELRIITMTWLYRFGVQDGVPTAITSLHDAVLRGDYMTDRDLLTPLQRMSVYSAHQTRSRKARKKRRLNFHDCSILTKPNISTTTDIPRDAYSSLAEDDKCVLWQKLILLAEKDWSAAHHQTSNLLSGVSAGRGASRVMALLAIRALVKQSNDPQLLDLRTSDFGQACTAALRSSIRELRIAGAQSLPLFLRDDLSETLRCDNRKTALEYLRALSEKNAANEQETLIMAWGQIALTCGHSEMNLSLLQLVEYLGHPNPLVCAWAATEIENIANATGKTAKELFQPFWRSIAVSVVQDLLVKPQKAQQLVDILEMDLKTFLALTQTHTVPALVLGRKKDILQRVALARDKGTNVQDLCMTPINLVAILTLLLAQPVADPEDLAYRCLCEAVPAVESTDIASLAKSEPVLLPSEMLKHCGEEAKRRREGAHQAFVVLASIVEREPGQRKSSSRSARAATELLERSMLGIIFEFSKTLESPSQPSSEKVRCLNGIKEMLLITDGHVSLALPQIRACLQTGLEQPELRTAAFEGWLSLLPVLHADDIIRIVDETFVVITRHWASLSPDLQKETHDALGALVKAHNKILQENILTLPSLSGIPLLSKFAAEFDRLKKMESVEAHFEAFTARLNVDSRPIVQQALRELVHFLEAQQRFVHDNVASENPAPVLHAFLRALLDATAKHSAADPDIAEMCGRALGIIGCLDPNRIEIMRPRRQLRALSNFEKAAEVLDWVVVLLEDVLVNVYKSTTDTRAQGFLAFVMQQLLQFCEFSGPVQAAAHPHSSQHVSQNTRWMNMAEHVRATLTPLLTSRYSISGGFLAPKRKYPIFSVNMSHSEWLRSLATDLMHKATGVNAKLVFPLVARVARTYDSIAAFVLPYVVLNLVLGGTVTETRDLTDEFLAVLKAEATSSLDVQESIRLCNESVFAVLDYVSTWLREKRKALMEMRANAFKTGVSPDEFEEVKEMGQIETVETFMKSIPAKTIADRAVDCRSDARALYHWEQHIRQKRSLIPSSRMTNSDDELYNRLLDIYSEIDEPDGLEGISAHLSVLTEAQQARNNSKAGRWTAAQGWYELHLSETPDDRELQSNVLHCLRETGQYAPLLRYADSFLRTAGEDGGLVGDTKLHRPMAIEACWMTHDMKKLESHVSSAVRDANHDFNIGIGKILLHANSNSMHALNEEVRNIQRSIAKSLSIGGTESLQKCHSELAKLHVIYEIESLMSAEKSKRADTLQNLGRRLAAVGTSTQDKLYILGVRREIMILLDAFERQDIGASWLITAKLARQGNNTRSAYNAVLKAFDFGDGAAKLEEARLLWHDGHQRQAISLLDSAIASGMFESLGEGSKRGSVSESSEIRNQTQQNLVLAKALLLHAKWLDASGQSQTKDMTEKYQLAAKQFQRWEKGHYYLGKHYNKLLDAQRALPKDKRSISFETGEMAKLVIDNTIRSIPFGNKYWHETIPRILTLWLELGMDTLEKAPREDRMTFEKREKSLFACTRQLQKYFDRTAPYVYYPSLAQLISRITHPHPEVWKLLSSMIIKVTAAHPRQVLWSLFAVVKARDTERAARGREILERLKDPKLKVPKSAIGANNIAQMITQGQKLCDGLLHACEAPIEQRVTHVRLSRDLNFKHSLAPSPLVVPIEATLTASLPSMHDNESVRSHKAFTQDSITIVSFAESVLVLSSLQRPRKITVRGSNGQSYGLLCKPKDDLRKDQRLMEFNSIINRSLKRDNQSSRRRLYIKTYAVTPLSEESGTIEWVEGIKPIRDILLNLYSRKGVRPNYSDIKKDLDEACKSPDHMHIFADRVLSTFPPCMHEWFSETYPEPDAWFTARLRYARSAAVMSMTGHMLGLGDRHGENILLEESTGGVFHVDFNCLFDKGLTFEKPELVPFRLTHNMEDAMGAYGHEGPFRKSSELTLGLLRQERDTLMTVLETFLYDPTTDFVGKKKRNAAASAAGVPETPAEILESVKTKLKGLLRGETVPLSVEGYVDALINQATNHANLAGMYIGWCSFL